MITFVYSDAYIAFIKYINLKLLGDEELKMGSDTQSNCIALLYEGRSESNLRLIKKNTPS